MKMEIVLHKWHMHSLNGVPYHLPTSTGNRWFCVRKDKNLRHKNCGSCLIKLLVSNLVLKDDSCYCLKRYLLMNTIFEYRNLSTLCE